MGALGIAEVNKALGKGGEGIKFPLPITATAPGGGRTSTFPSG